jgi:hypothetical protein
MARYPNYLPADRLFLARLSEAVSSRSIRNHRYAIRTDKLAIRSDSYTRKEIAEALGFWTESVRRDWRQGRLASVSQLWVRCAS